MFGKRVIRLGDPTSHGGVVVSATSNFIMFDKPVARIGDNVTCRVRGHNTCVIVEGDPTWTIDGRNVALEGHKTSCGASLISTLPNVGRSYEGMGVVSSALGFTKAALASTGSASSRASSDDVYDEQTQLLAPPIEGVPYFIKTSDDRTFSGRAEVSGMLPRIDTNDENEYTVYWGDEALARINGLDA